MISNFYYENFELLENFSYKFTKLFIKAAEKKIDFIGKLQVGYSTLTKFNENVSLLSTYLFQLKNDYFYET